ncbi:MAG: signal transduction histidine kinase, nitrogen specific, NtrB [Verrucomicrobia bacterium]|nr:signal transduction histidine kinase, nitrogen specific, NtrB [Verrucomicrobiota bacterium]
MKVLHVEDNVHDAELIHQLVLAEWPHCDIKVVTTEQGLRSELANGPVDVILSDFSLPTFSGMGALNVSRELTPQTPFIFISGTIGEDRAIAAVKSGARDYVLKDRMKRLVLSMQDALRESQEQKERQRVEGVVRQQSDILNRAREGIVIGDLEGRIIYWNTGAERIFGWTTIEVMGRTVAELWSDPEESLQLRESDDALRAKGEWQGEIRLRRKVGNPLYVEMRRSVVFDSEGRPTAQLSLVSDISERKSLEEQMHRAQRLENIGLLASGIAHDLNNMLAPMLLAVPMLRVSAVDDTSRRLLATMEYSAERGAALVRQILGFAKGVGGEAQLLQVRHLLRETAKFVTGTFPSNVMFEDDLPTDLWTVKVNPTQLNQVLLNLCVNARDAMPNGGTLRLRAENCVLSEPAAMIIEGGRPGSFLVIEVSDTGTGIPPEVLEHMWEPFVTTKAAGKGTGLGLSTVRGIIRNHQGFIELKTELGHGTSFRIYLPAAEGKVEEPSGLAPAPVPNGHGEHILVVDDEEPIRDVISAILGQHGYRVTTAADGAEATACFAKHASDIELVVLDHHMPNLSGSVLAKVLRHINPNVRTLMVSGLASAAGSRAPMYSEQYEGAFLLKPFKPEVLLRKVQELLAQKKK